MKEERALIKLALLGYPVSHSASPAMMEAALLARGLSGSYELWPTPPGQLASSVARLRQEGFLGANVTLPHKEEALSLAEEAEESALRAGAANVLYRRGERLIAANTDGEGLLRALLEVLPSVKGLRVVWIGAGGATLTAGSALLAEGAQLTIVSRDRAKGQKVAARLGAEWALLGAGLSSALSRCDVLIQATPAMMYEEEAKVLLSLLPLSSLSVGALVCDLVYRPKRTLLLLEAARYGLATLDGSRMLLYQGALAFTRFTQKEAPLDAMSEALSRVLAREQPKE